MNKKWFTGLACVLAGCSLAGCDAGNSSSSEFNYNELPYYTANIDDLTYSYTDEERVRPFWQGNVMYNETVMFFENGNNTAKATTMFKPLKILGVYDWSLKRQYIEGVDYTVSEDGSLVCTENSAIPTFNEDWCFGKNIPDRYEKIDTTAVIGNKYCLMPGADMSTGNAVDLIYTEGALIYERYVHVTYAYDPASFDYEKVNSYANELFGLEEKLKAGEDINMVVFGDSVSEGCSTSGHWQRDPGCPFYGGLVKNELERLYNSNITLTNMSLGGMTSKWGVGIDTSNGGGYNLTKLRELAPDFLVIGFGGNDVHSVPATDFVTNIETIVETARGVNPDCQIVFLNFYPINEYFVNRSKQEILTQTYKEFSYNYAGATFVDMYTTGIEVLKTKKHIEITANNLNHPNDFFHRIIAMNILSAIVDY